VLLGRQTEHVAILRSVVEVALSNTDGMVFSVLFNFLLFVKSHNVGSGDTVSRNFWQGILLSLSFGERGVVILNSSKGG